MRASMTILLLASCSLTGHLTANAGESLDRLGRLWGFGWSDGYHACGSDCYRVGENLPPLSYSAQHALYPASTRKHSYSVHGSTHASSNCAGGDCQQNRAPEEWQGMSQSLTPTIAPGPVQLDVYPAPSRPFQPAPVEMLPAPAPKPKSPAIEPQRLRPAPSPLLEDEDDDDLLAPPRKPAKRAPILEDDEDSLLPSEPSSPLDSDLGSYLNEPMNSSPYRTTSRPMAVRPSSSAR